MGTVGVGGALATAFDKLVVTTSINTKQKSVFITKISHSVPRKKQKKTTHCNDLLSTIITACSQFQAFKSLHEDIVQERKRMRKICNIY